MKRKGTMPATLSLEDAGSRGNGAQGEQAGPPGRGGGALAGVTGHPADTPDAGIFKEAAGVQQANHLALRKLPHPPGKRAQPSYTAREWMFARRGSAQEDRAMVWSPFPSAHTKLVTAQKRAGATSRLQGGNGDPLVGDF